MHDQKNLLGLSEPGLQASLERSVDEAIKSVRESRWRALPKIVRDGERARLITQMRDWLDHERKRPGFEVVAVEEKVALKLGGIKISMRVDRIDRTPSGGIVIIDYKTGLRAQARAMVRGASPRTAARPVRACMARPLDQRHLQRRGLCAASRGRGDCLSVSRTLKPGRVCARSARALRPRRGAKSKRTGRGSSPPWRRKSEPVSPASRRATLARPATAADAMPLCRILTAPDAARKRREGDHRARARNDG